MKVENQKNNVPPHIKVYGLNGTCFLDDPKLKPVNYNPLLKDGVLIYGHNNFILGFLGIVLFFLVISVLYIFIFISDIIKFNNLQFFMPLIIFTGFFIFLVAAMLLALSIFKTFNRII